MFLGQKGLFLFILTMFINIPLSASNDVKNEPDLEKLASQVSLGNWNTVLEETESFQTDPLLALLRQKARFELKKWNDIIEAAPNQDARFEAYDQYIRMLALYESEQYEKVQTSRIFPDLPTSFQEYLRLLQARSFIAQKKLGEGKKAFRKFLDDFPNSRFKADAMLELANVEWELENKFEALHLFEKIYIYYPISDSDNLAPQRLKEMGRFESLDPGIHLKRIQTLQRAALFTKAIRELRALERITEGAQKEKIRFSLASLEFARKNYSKSESFAKTGLNRTKESYPDMEKDWRSLLAFSLVRQGEYEKAREQYDQLLKMKIPGAEKEQILLRLGLMALDDKDFESAETYFAQLRTQFSDGRYKESAHWFQSWSILQQYHELKDKIVTPTFRKKLITSVDLLEKLPKLPQGLPLTGQALYWKAKAQEALKEKNKSNKTLAQLSNEWSASFYSLLSSPESFDFLNYQEKFAAPELIAREDKKFLIADPAFQQMSWKRLEAFVSVRLYNWAHLELENFMRVSGKKNEGLRQAVAHRLQVLEDWSDLVKFAQRHFPLELSQIKHGEPLSHFHYPQAYGEEVLKAANEFQVSPFLVWGVMREESRFQADAVSSAGAVGLLQLMPNLANQIAVQLRERRVTRHQLTEPSLNIRYSAYHLRELIDQVQSWKVPKEFVFPLVVASYNAGAGPARRWLKENGDKPLDVFIESIPYSETRNYVKRVIQSANIYWRLYGEKNNRLATNAGGEKL